MFCIRFLSVVLCALFLGVGGAVAQSVTPDYSEWAVTAERVENAIEGDRASFNTLEALRADVAGWREQFLSAQSENGARITTLQSQLDALGLAPEGDATETDEIAARRTELSEQLARLNAPVLRAEEAFNRADGLVQEIDTTIRARQTDALLELNPTPVNPALWPRALEILWGTLGEINAELRNAIASDVQRAQFRANLPPVLGLILLALVLVSRGRRWMIVLIDRLRDLTDRGTGVWSFVLSLGQILLPVAGIYALTRAADATGMIGSRGLRLLDLLPVLGFMLFFIRWLADQCFSRAEKSAILAQISRANRREARYYSNVLALLVVAHVVIVTLGDIADWSVSTRAVLDFPVLALCGLILFRLGQILRLTGGTEAKTEAGQVDSRAFGTRIVRLVGRAAMILGVAGPLMSAVGYTNLGEAVIYPAIVSLALFGFVLVLQRFVGDLYELVTGRDVTGGDSLIPVLGSLVLTLVALPVLALIWGARVADLTELWTQFREGFQIGDSRISPMALLTVAVVFGFGYMLTRLLQGGLRASVLPKTKIDPGGQNAIVVGLGYAGIFIAALVAITSAGIDLSSVAIVAGALSVGIGFGLQNIVSNFVAGIILLVERPISEGDWIDVNGYTGYVRHISVRSTRIETFDRTDVIVPNADFVSGIVTNYTRGNSIGRVIVPVGVAYGTDTRKVEEILKWIAREHDMVLMSPEPSVIFQGFGADSLDFEIRAILRDVNYVLSVKSDMNHEINRRFAEEGIEIPFAQRDVWLRNPEVLTGGIPAVTPPQTSLDKAPPAATRDLDGADAGIADANPDGDVT